MAKTSRIIAFSVPFLILLSYALLLTHPINLITADLGRHIKNGGEIVAGNFSALKTNYYSYTFPGYPTLNHHWLGGVIFFLVWKAFGFLGVHLFFILISLSAFFIFFKLAYEKSGLAIASFIAILLMPLVLERDEIRPEIFSNLFAAVFLFMLSRFRDGRLKPKYLLILPALELVWVNTHIYFFLGFVIAGAFFIEALMFRRPFGGRNPDPESHPNGIVVMNKWFSGVGAKSKPAVKKLASVLGLMAVASLINPAGVMGVLAPFDIFKNYGYTIVENQNIFFLESLIKNPNFLIFKIMFSAFFLLIVFRLIQNKRGIPASDLIFAAGFSIAAFLALRNMTLFALFAIPIASGCVAGLIGNPVREKSRHGGTEAAPTGAAFSNVAKTNLLTVAVLLFFILSIISGEYKSVVPYEKLGLGLSEGNNGAAEFIKNQNLEGPIFNNYDIGGYLIFNLWPERKVFVDNRPEAYPNEFFQKVYMPMQEDEKIWREQLKIYGFKTIIFSTADYTPWGRTFLARIIKDPEWSTVYKDDRVIILTKN